jgi:hypothetical protein
VIQKPGQRLYEARRSLDQKGDHTREEKARAEAKTPSSRDSTYACLLICIAILQTINNVYSYPPSQFVDLHRNLANDKRHTFTTKIRDDRYDATASIATTMGPRGKRIFDGKQWILASWYFFLKVFILRPICILHWLKKQDQDQRNYRFRHRSEPINHGFPMWWDRLSNIWAQDDYPHDAGLSIRLWITSTRVVDCSFV